MGKSGQIPCIQSVMKRLLLASLLLSLSLGCSQQKASDRPSNDPNASRADPQSQDRAHDKGVQVGEKARQLEEETRPERQKLAKQTADAAEKLKQESLKMGDRAAAAAQGIKQGWNKNGSAENSQMVDVNTADSRRLQSLPGITIRKAHLIISSRPYSSPQELVSKRAISQADYNRIQDRVTASEQSGQK